MAQVATSGQKATMRSKGQWSEMFAAIHFPSTIYSARLLAVPTTTDMIAEITFGSGVGTLANVKADMTLWVGTTAGSYDLGICRIRKAPIAGTFYIGEQSRVDWQASCYLTVVDDFDLKAKHIRIDAGVPKMDFDVTYSDQHTVFNPVPVLGPMVRVAKLVAADVDVQLGPESGYASWVFGSTISAYLWECATATFDSATIANPVATIDSVGWHRFTCTVTAANGKTKQGVRWVYIWDDDNLPYKIAESPDWNEDVNSNGVNFNITLVSDAALSDIPDRALCVLFSVDHYDSYSTGSTDSVGPITDAENIEGTGRIMAESIDYDAEKSQVSFTVQGFQEWFKVIPGFPSGLEMAINTPAAWTDMPALTVDRFLWHFLEWRCTATTIMDIKLTDNDLYALELSSLGSDLWSQMDEVTFSTIFGSMSVDQYGRFFAEIEPQMVPEADRDWPTVMDLTKVDFFDASRLDRVITPEIAQVEFSGVSVDISGQGSSYFSVSYGRIPGDYGTLSPDDKYLVENQADSNQKAGLLMGWATNEYKPITLNLLNNKMISCFPRQFVGFTLALTDTIRGISMTINLLPRRRRLVYNAQTGFKYYQVEFEAETFEQISVVGDTPGTTDSGIQPIPGFPDIPGYPELIFNDTSSTPDGPPVFLIADDTKGMLFTINGNSDSPTYRFWNTGIDPAEIPLIVGDHDENCIFALPSGGWYCATRNNYVPYGELTFGNLYYAPSLGARWQKIIDRAWINNELGTTGDYDGKIWAVGCNYTKLDEIAFIVGTDWTRKFYLGNATSGFTQKSSFGGTGTGFPTGNLTFGAEKWLYDVKAASWGSYYRFDADGTSPVYLDTVVVWGQGSHWTKRAGTSPLLYMAHDGVFPASEKGLWYSPDNGDSWTKIFTPTESISWFLTVSPSGQELFCEIEVADRGRSLDAGYSWDSSFFTFGGPFCYAYAGGAGAESHWLLGRGYVRLSIDGGANWLAREGNLPYLIPTGMKITKIVVPGHY